MTLEAGQNRGEIRRPESARCWARAQNPFVGGVNSPVRAYRGLGVDPVFVRRMEGPYVFDVDGNRYVDLVGSWGTAVVGHAHPEVVSAVRRAAGDGLSFGANCEAEVELAELITGAIPSMAKLRFVNSGTEAVMSAIRVARAFTGRERIVKFAGCYHGHADSLLVAAGSGAATHSVPDSAGVPESFAALTLTAPYNDLSAAGAIMDRHGGEVAAIIVEPVAGNMGLVFPAEGFLAGLRELCTRHGSVLIFDEVMTGFRVGWGGVQNQCGVTPDLTCLGKVIGGGLPVAAYGGPAKIMEMVSPVGPAYQAGTLSGNPLGMAAGLATLQICRADGFYPSLDQGAKRLADGLRALAGDAGIPLQADHIGGMIGLAFSAEPVTNFDDARAADDGRFAAFFRTMLDRGVWLPPSGFEALFISAAHDDATVDAVLAAAEQGFRDAS